MTSPNPSITEVFNESSTTLVEGELTPCIVGSLVQVVTKQPVSISLPIEELTILSYPNLRPKAVVNSITFEVSNATILILDAQTNITGVGLTNQLSSPGLFSNVQTGDIVQIPNCKASFIVDTATNNQIVLTSKLFMSIANTFPITIIRNIPLLIATPINLIYSQLYCTFTALTYNSFPIISGNVLISYTAQRSDLLGFYEVTDLTQLAFDMDINPFNPLGFYLGNIMKNTSDNKIIMAYITPDNTEESYINALANMRMRNTFYSINSIVTNMPISHDIADDIIAATKPDPSYERVGIIPTMTEAQFLSTGLIFNVTSVTVASFTDIYTIIPNGPPFRFRDVYIPQYSGKIARFRDIFIPLSSGSNMIGRFRDTFTPLHSFGGG